MNAPNLSDLLNKTQADAPRPVALPDGTYYGVIKAQEFMTSTQKKTPGCQYTVQLTHAHEDVDLSEELNNPDFKPINERIIKSTGTTLWLSENALFQFFDFMQSLGIETEGRTIKELAPQPVGQAVMLDITRLPNRAGDGFYNDIRRMTAAQ
jgi:hypothetical protein